jgi:polar amino acid transport system substrate-binding protein
MIFLNFYFIFFLLFILFYFIFIKINLKTILSIFSLAIIFSLITAKFITFILTKEEQKEKIIKVGVSPDYPPFTFIENNTICGFDIDLLNIIEKKLNKKIQILAIPFDTILPSLQVNNINIAISGLSGTPERAKNILISNPYLNINPVCILSLANNPILSINELQDQSIIVNTGYTTDQYINKLNKNIKIERFKGIGDALIALNNNRGVAFVTTYFAIKNIVPQVHKYHLEIIENTNEALSIFVNKQEKELFNEINHIILELEEDGTINQLMEKWELK